jgi:hypothetical protein
MCGSCGWHGRAVHAALPCLLRAVPAGTAPAPGGPDLREARKSGLPEKSSSELQPFSYRLITVDGGGLKVIEQPAALGHQHQQAAA